MNEIMSAANFFKGTGEAENGSVRRAFERMDRHNLDRRRRSSGNVFCVERNLVGGAYPLYEFYRVAPMPFVSVVIVNYEANVHCFSSSPSRSGSSLRRDFDPTHYLVTLARRCNDEPPTTKENHRTKRHCNHRRQKARHLVGSFAKK